MGNANSVDIEAVKSAELEVILGKPVAKDGSALPPAMWGLALSGGGIRSATFSLGVLQELARLNVLLGFHYQSTVSGGGYAGAFLQGLIQRYGLDGAIAVLNSSVSKQATGADSGTDKSAGASGKADAKDEARGDGKSGSEEPANTPTDPHSQAKETTTGAVEGRGRDKQTAPADSDAKRNNFRPILHLREYSNYLSPRKAALSGDTLGMFGTYVRNVILIQIQLCALFVGLSLLPLFLYPWIRHIAISSPKWCLLWATVLGFGGAMLLGLVITSTRRSTSKNQQNDTDPRSRTRWRSEPEHLVGVTDKTELAGTWVKAGAVGIIWALALSAVFSTFGLWGMANSGWVIVRCDALNATQCAPHPSVGEKDPTYGGAFSIRDRPPSTAPDISASMDSTDQKKSAHRAKHAFIERIEKAAPQTSKENPPRPLSRGQFFRDIFFLYVLSWVAWLVYDERSRSTNVPSELLNRIARVLFAAVIAGAFLAGSVNGIRDIFGRWNENAGLWQAIIVGPLLTLAAFMLTGVLQLGLAGNAFTDLQREVWARVGGKTAALAVIGIALPMVLVVCGPWFYRSGLPKSGLGGLKVGSIVTWILTTGSGVVAAYTQSGNDQQKISRILDVIARVAPWIFLLGLSIAISMAAQVMLHLDYPGGLNPFLEKLGENLTEEEGCQLAVVVAAALLTWGIFGLVIDINEFSLNAFYRNRLVRCYLGASNQDREPEPTTNFDLQDDIRLSDVIKSKDKDVGPRPLFPIIGTTLNLLAVKQLDWLQRKAASFFFTPGYCGYLPPPSHPWSEPVGDTNSKAAGTRGPGHNDDSNPPRSVASRVTLGDAIAISGAAVSPNMGYHSSPAATFLLTIFDARLGWWLPNPRLRRKSDFSTVFWGSWLIKEMLGLTDETGKFIYLSDGGHFENLGIYELVRRGCHFILAVDASGDPHRDFQDLGNAVQKCRTDFGVDIKIDVSGLRRNDDGISLRSCALGRIEYPVSGTDEKKIGLLLYIKPTLTGKEPADVAYYARSHPSFPHESTYNQFFDEAQFESYRRLGIHVVQNALEPTLERVTSALPDDKNSISVIDSDKKERILEELGYRWAHFPKKPAVHALTHLNAMSRLFGELRRDPELSALDAELYPAWEGLRSNAGSAPKYQGATAPAAQKTLLEGSALRKCFYFCQELAHLMESVYHDLNLEQLWNHIDNRGWMNAFRQWGSSPLFRKAWVMGSPNYGSRYVAFCQQWLGFPQLASVVEVRNVNDLAELKKINGNTGNDWRECCDTLIKYRYINQREYGAMMSSPVTSTNGKNRRAFLLQMDWSEMKREKMEAGESALARGAGENEARDSFSTLGVAVISDEKIVIFRIQNHLRRLGLGKQFMSKLVAVCPAINGVAIKEGNYGVLLGDYTQERAKRATDRTRALWQKVKAQQERKGRPGGKK